MTNGENALNVVWSRDGEFVIFQTPSGMFWKRADGAGEARLLKRRKLVFPSSFSREGTQFAFTQQILAGGGEIWTLPVNVTRGQLQAGEPRLLLKTASPLTFPALSPDGRWLAYADAEGGTYQIYVRAFPDR